LLAALSPVSLSATSPLKEPLVKVEALAARS
jgi:hypothetical protein